jgi:hypothetical protein
VNDIAFPERSVTRFFIPLIDVLLLLFCIYLLLPIARGPVDAPVAGALEDAERRELERLRHTVAAIRPEPAGGDIERLEALRHERMTALAQRLAIRVLEIDADSGKLYYRDRDRVPISDETSAHLLIERHRREAVGQELYYLILFPRKLTGYPEERQVRQYDAWLSDVAHGFDNPLAAR